jgi:cathepsin B
MSSLTDETNVEDERESDSLDGKTFKTQLSKNPTNTILKGDSRAAKQKYQDLIPEPSENLYSYIRELENIHIPDNFDGKKVWSKYLSSVIDQKECGSCWAFSAVCVLADRFNIHSLGKIHLNLSPVPILLCNTHGAANPGALKDLERTIKLFESVQKLYGCNGNLLSEAWRMLYTLGTNDVGCMPLDILKWQTPSSCIKLTGPAGDMCADYRFNYNNNTEYGTPAKFYSAFQVYAVPGTPKEKSTDISICRDIYKFGPVSSAFEVYKDFYLFDPVKEIYKSNYKGGRVSGHAIVIDGWGIENGVKYWWVRNSWGPEWGINGYFRIIRGENHCKIEENVITGLPDLNSAYFVVPDKFNLEDVPKDVKNKFLMHSQNNTAGGIDSETGYSRRIISYLKNKELVDSTSNEEKITMPNYETFIAGEIGSKTKPQTSSFTLFSPKINNKFYGIFILIFSIFSIFLMYKYIKK